MPCMESSEVLDSMLKQVAKIRRDNGITYIYDDNVLCKVPGTWLMMTERVILMKIMGYFFFR